MIARYRLRSLACVISVSLLVAACGKGGSAPNPVSGPSPTPAPAPGPAPTPAPNPTPAHVLHVSSTRGDDTNSGAQVAPF